MSNANETGAAPTTTETSTPLGPDDSLPPDLKKQKVDGDVKTSSTAVNGNNPVSGAEGEAEDSLASRVEIVSMYADLEALPVRSSRIPALAPAEVRDLEKVLEFDETETWRDDWAGNLAFADKEILNPQVKSGKQSFRQSLFEWAKNNTDNTRLIWNLVRYVCQMKSTPDPARRLLSGCDPNSLSSMEKTIRRTMYDPSILRQDGWTTAKSSEKVGATGGPFLIGERVRWDHADAVVIAYVHDDDMGDLWKAMWTDQEDHGGHLTFDLEAEELFEAKRKYERSQQLKQRSMQASDTGRVSSRLSLRTDFQVKGIEMGIVLAASFSKGARPGVYWPARVMHASEIVGSAGKRSSSKQKIDLIFLAPYWNSIDQASRGRRVESLSESGASVFSSGPLFLLETVEATEEMIREYPYDGKDGLDLIDLQTAFRFTGLPRAAFPRFLDSHRLALALRNYAKAHLDCQVTPTDKATAGLFETHPMAVQAPTFPPVVLHLPLEYILSQLPHPDNQQLLAFSNSKERKEPVLQLGRIIDSMQPPQCWGINGTVSPNLLSPNLKTIPAQENAPVANVLFRPEGEQDFLRLEDTGCEKVLHDFEYLKKLFGSSAASSPVADLLKSLIRFLSSITRSKNEDELSQPDHTLEQRKRCKASAIVESWVHLKRLGEDTIYSFLAGQHKPSLAEWQRCSEQLYKYMTSKLPDLMFHDGMSIVLTDSQCNGHLTSNACFERSVRLPAAIKGAKLAGARAGGPVKLVTEVHQKYINYVEEKLLIKAHGVAYLKRIKSRCALTTSDSEVIKLTDDSSGEGGEDTCKYRVHFPGSYGQRTHVSTSGCFRRIERNLDCIRGGSCSRCRSNQYGSSWGVRQCILCHQTAGSSRRPFFASHESSIKWVLCSECSGMCRHLRNYSHSRGWIRPRQGLRHRL